MKMKTTILTLPSPTAPPRVEEFSGVDEVEVLDDGSLQVVQAEARTVTLYAPRAWRQATSTAEED